MMQSLRLNKVAAATALALIFGPSVQVAEAGNLCSLPGAQYMGMGCGGNVNQDSTGQQTVGPAPQFNAAPQQGGSNTVAGFLQEFQGRQIPVYELTNTGTAWEGTIQITSGGAAFYNYVGAFAAGWATPDAPNWSGYAALDPMASAVITGLILTPYSVDMQAAICRYANNPSTVNASLVTDQLLAGSPGSITIPAYGCQYTCFPAGTRVFMADGSERLIEFIRVGDWLMGADGNPVQPHKIDRPHLGSRRMMAMADSSLLWSEEHGMWTRDSAETGSEWWWSASPERWRAEVENGAIGGLHDNQSMRTGDGFDFAHLEGWKSQEVIEASGYGPETQLYLPLTNGVPIIVNGYVVGAGINEDGYDYKTFRWSPARIADALARQALFRVMRMTPTHASSSVLAEAMA